MPTYQHAITVLLWIIGVGAAWFGFILLVCRILHMTSPDEEDPHHDEH